MANVQLAVAGDETTQVILSVPGVQGPAGSNLPPSGTTNQVLYKQSSTDYDTAWSLVTSAMITDGTIVNGDINASAAIAGTKISPNFGSQNVVTTGTATAASFIPTSSGVPANGLYLPSANNVAISTNGSGKLFVDASGNVGVGNNLTSPQRQLHILAPVFGANLTGGFRYGDLGNNYYVDQLITTDGGSNPFVETKFASHTLSKYAYGGGNNYWEFYTNNSPAMRITSTGLVGVGTGNPQALLHIKDASASAYCYSIPSASENAYIECVTSGSGRSGTTYGLSNANLAVINAASPSAFAIGTNSDTAPVVFATNGNERLRITAAGLVGIGTSNVLGILHAKATTNGNFHIRTLPDVGGSGEGFAIDSLNDAQNSVRPIGFRATTYSFFGSGTTYATLNSTGLGIGTTPDSPLHVVGTSGTGLRIGYTNNTNYFDANTQIFRSNNATTTYGQWDSSGRLLVGTSTSASTGDAQYAKLQVLGNTYPGGFSGALSLRSTKVAGTDVNSGDRLAVIYLGDSSGSAFAEIGCEADGTVSSASDVPGRLVFSTTLDGQSSPTARVRINNAGNVSLCADAEMLYGTTTAAAGTSSALVDLYSGGTAGSFGSGTRRFLIFTNGNVQNSNGSYGTLSDIKLKENVTDANSQWDDIKAVRIRNWNFKAETGHETHRQIGPIAQELQTVCPGLVFETPDRDEDGNETGEVTKGVNQSVLYMKAVKALQEAMERIEQLESEMAAVKAQLA